MHKQSTEPARITVWKYCLDTWNQHDWIFYNHQIFRQLWNSSSL